jgi:oligopeptide transport system substrate-binding protein
MRRTGFVAGALALLCGCAADSDYFGRISPPEGQVFRFNNGAEPEFMDPQLMTGQPDGRIAWALFEGLTGYHPETLAPVPGVAERWELSADGRVHTFHLRRDARWSNGDPVTAEDFVYSWRRFLAPETAAQYAYLLFSVPNAEAYNSGQLLGSLRLEALQTDGAAAVLDPAGLQPASFYLGTEVLDEEATDRLAATVTLPVPGAPEPLQGSMLVAADGTASGELTGQLWRGGVLEEVSLAIGGRLERNDAAGSVTGRMEAEGAGFRLSAAVSARRVTAEDLAFRALDDYTFEVTLRDPVQYFLALCAFYPLVPVPRAVIERHGRAWSQSGNLVGNGAFRLIEHSLQNRIVMVRNEQYWDAASVRLDKVIAYPVELYTTACDLYKAGELDLNPSNYILLEFIPSLLDKKDYHTFPYLASYFYRANVTRPPMNDKRVRRALSLSVDRQALAKFLRAGQIPAQGFVPPGIEGYEPPEVLRYDVEEARRLLAEAGYPGGKGFPRVSILYNTTEQHRKIAEILQREWKQKLGIDVGLRNEEWKVYLKSQRNVDYDLSRSGWIGDYTDPNTFLDMWLTGGGNNNTGFSSPVYDELIAAAAREPDPVRRMQIFHEAETLLLDELPIIPLFIYTTYYLKKPYVRGYHSNIKDVHPLKHVWIDHDWEKSGERPEEAARATARGPAAAPVTNGAASKE